MKYKLVMLSGTQEKVSNVLVQIWFLLVVEAETQRSRQKHEMSLTLYSHIMLCIMR